MPSQMVAPVVPEDNEKEESQSIKQLVEAINANPSKAIGEMHSKICKQPPSVAAFLQTRNMAKNRYSNLLLYDANRVILDDDLGEDYIHASYVDSYDRPGSIICAQAPFDVTTEQDFWRLCNQLKPCLVVLLTSLKGSDGNSQIKKFWPESKQGQSYCGDHLRVKINGEVSRDRDFDLMDISVKADVGKYQGNYHFGFMIYNKWVNDLEAPDNLLEFRAMMKINLARAEKDNRGDGPVILACPSGIHRCGVLAALDILIDRMTIERKVGLKETVMAIRRQRYAAFHNFEHYSYVADLIVRHAVSSGIVDPNFIGIRK